MVPAMVPPYHRGSTVSCDHVTPHGHDEWQSANGTAHPGQTATHGQNSKRESDQVTPNSQNQETSDAQTSDDQATAAKLGGQRGQQSRWLGVWRVRAARAFEAPDPHASGPRREAGLLRRANRAVELAMVFAAPDV